MAAAKKARASLQERARGNGLKFVGKGGAHVSGVPARDLSPKEVAALDNKEFDLCVKTGLYKIGSDEQEGD